MHHRKETPAEYAARQKRRPVIVASAPALLYVDGFNYLKRFLGRVSLSNEVDKDVDLLKECRIAEKNVETFMCEARTAGWQVTVFLDNVKLLEEEQKSYWERSAKYLNAGGRDVLANCGVFLGDLFRRFGARVLFALGADNDATLAAFANEDDSAILSSDNDFLRYYGRRASGEPFFLRRIFSGFSIGDERNQGKLALFRKQIPDELLQERCRPDWTLITAIGENKGSKIRFLPSKPSTSTFCELVTERDSTGSPVLRVVSSSTYPFAYPCPAAQDAVRLARPLRLAALAALGERRVTENALVWVHHGGAAGDGGFFTLERRAYTWVQTPAGWFAELTPPADAADSWEDAADDAGASEGDDAGAALTPEEQDRYKACTRLLAAFAGVPEGKPDAAWAALSALYDAVFPAGSLPTALDHPDGGARVTPTRQQARNEALSRFMIVLWLAGAAAGEARHSDVLAHLERHAAREHPE